MVEVQYKLTGMETAQYSYDYYVFLLRLFLSLDYSRDKQQQQQNSAILAFRSFCVFILFFVF